MRQTRLALALSAVLVSSVHAETLPEYVADTIVVTPSRFPQALSGQSASTTVITREEIENSPQATLPELLAQQAGVAMRDLYGNAGSATIDLRGIGAGASQNVLILLDGRRLNDIDLSAIDWSALPLSAIERVEIVRGGSSVLHGAGAVAGVVNIITRSPVAQTNEVGGRVRVGSFNTRNYALSGNFAGDAAGLRVAADHTRSDGWRDNNESEQTSANGDARWKHGRGEFVLKFGGAKHDTRLPGPRTVEADQGIDQLVSDPEGTNTPLDWAQRKSYQAGLASSFAFGRHEAIVDLDYRNKQQRAYFDFAGWPEYKEADLDMLTLSPRVRAPLATGSVRHLVTVGADLQRWDYGLLTSNAPENIGTPINDVSAVQRSAGIYARDEMQVGEATRVTAGARYERFAIDAHDTHDATAPGGAWGSGATPGNQDESEHALELGLNQRVGAEHALFARVARSFRFATVDEIYGYSPGFLHEFQFLRPQTSHDLQAGWEWARGRSRLRTTAYYMRVKDEIHLDIYTTGVGNTNYSPLERYGLELEANERLHDFDLHLAYALAYAKFTDGTLDGVDLDGNDVPLVPRHKVALGSVWHLGGQTRLAADVQYVSRQRMDNDEPNRFRERIPSYTLVDLKLMHEIGNWKLSAAANNVLDEVYYTYAVHSVYDNDRFNAYPLPGRHGWVSAEYAFK